MSACDHQWYPVAGNRLHCTKCGETCSPVDEIDWYEVGAQQGREAAEQADSEIIEADE